MTFDIFISYSQQDKKLVHKYAKHLESIGYSVWYDVKGLYTGAEFSQEIVTAIENSELFLFFSSINSNNSDWTKGEILTAQKYKKHILPVKIDDTEYSKSTELILIPLQYIFINNTLSESIIKELDDAIAKFIENPNKSNDIDIKPINEDIYSDDKIKEIKKDLFKDLKFLGPIINAWFQNDLKAIYRAKDPYKQLAVSLYKKITIIEKEIVTVENTKKEEFVREMAGDEAQLKVAYKKFTILYNKSSYDLADKIDANEFSRIVETVKEKYKILLSKIKFNLNDDNVESIDSLLFQIEKSPHFEYLSMGLISSLASNISNMILQKIASNIENKKDATIYDNLVNNNNGIIFDNILERIKGEIFSVIEKAENQYDDNKWIKDIKQKQLKGFNQLEFSYNNLSKLLSSPSKFEELIQIPAGEYITS